MWNRWKKDHNPDDGNAEILKPGLSKQDDNDDNIQPQPLRTYKR